MHHKKLNAILFDILDNVKSSISNELYALNQEFISVGEPGIAFENICSYIDDNHLKLSRETYDKIVVAGKSMEMGPEEWSFLEKYVI
jgi:hypothetical protein